MCDFWYFLYLPIFYDMHVRWISPVIQVISGFTLGCARSLRSLLHLDPTSSACDLAHSDVSPWSRAAARLELGLLLLGKLHLDGLLGGHGRLGKIRW